MERPRPRGHVDWDGNLFATSATPSHWTGRDLLLRRYSHFWERKPPPHRLFRFNPPLCLLSTSHGWPRHQQKKRILLVARKSFTYIITNRQEAICTVSDCRWKTHRNQYALAIISCGIKVSGVFFVSPQTPIRSHLFAHHTSFTLYLVIFFGLFSIYSSCSSDSKSAPTLYYIPSTQTNQSSSATDFWTANWRKYGQIWLKKLFFFSLRSHRRTLCWTGSRRFVFAIQ